MPFDLDAYAKLRPYVHHLTAASNLQNIRESRMLHPASELAYHAGRDELRTRRRTDHATIMCELGQVQLRDQRPLHIGHMTLEGGWTFEQFVSSLNDRVFFWPGDEHDAIPMGQVHFKR